MSNPINVTLSEDEALVLVEFFARFAESDDFSMHHNAEFIALMSLSGQLDKAISATLLKNYAEQLSAAKKRLSVGFEGVATGVKTLS